MSDDVTERTALLYQENGAGNNDDDQAATSTSLPRATTNNLERVASISSARSAQYKGNAEIRSKLPVIVPAVSIGIFLSAADSALVASSYGVIGSELHALNLTSWIATSYFLSLTSFQPLYGKLSDIFGRKSCLIFAYIVFGLGTLGCGLSGSMGSLITWRVIQGVGGGGMTTVVSIIFSDIVPLKERGLWQGLINIIYALGAASGVSLGGLLADTIGWRWSFLAQTPLCLVALIAVAIVLKLPQSEESEEISSKLRRVDFLGAVTIILAVFCLLFGMDRGSNLSWRLPVSYGPVTASIILFMAFVYIEAKVAKEPFAPTHVIFRRDMFASYACYFFGFGAQLSMLYYLPLFYQAVDGFNATEMAVRMLPAVFSSVTGTIIAGVLIKWTGKYYWLTVFAYVNMVLGAVLLILCAGTITNSTWGISIGITLGSIGNGIGITTTLIALIAVAAPEDQAVATAGTYLFRQLGSTIGIALSSSIIQQVLRTTLGEELGSGKEAGRIVRGVRKSLKYIDTLDPAMQGVVRSAYGKAVSHAFMLVLFASFCALLASFFLYEKRLSK